MWGPAEACQGAAYLAAIGRLMPPPPPGAPGPFALSSEDALTDLLRGAGLTGVTIADAPAQWRYATQDTALRGMLASGPVIVAVEHSGDDAVRAAAIEAIAPFRRDDGSFVISNVFRYAIGTRPWSAVPVRAHPAGARTGTPLGSASAPPANGVASPPTPAPDRRPTRCIRWQATSTTPTGRSHDATSPRRATRV